MAQKQSDPRTDQKTQGEKKKKKQFFWFSLRVLHGFSRKSNEDEFSRKSNEDEFSRKSNGGWIFPEIEWGMDFLGNQTGLQKKKKKVIND